MPGSRQEWGEWLETLPDAAIVSDESGHIRSANRLAVALFGAEATALRGSSLASLFAAGDARRAVSPERWPEGGETMRADWALVRADGAEWYAEVAYRGASIEGSPALLVLLRDVTERRLAEMELRKSEERLRQAVRVSEIGIFDHQHACDTHLWTARQYEMYGWPEDEPITIPAFLARLYPDDRERIEVAIRKAHDPAGDGSFDVEHRILRTDGEVRWVSTRSVTLFSGVGAERRPVRTVGASVDFTERKQVEDGRARLAAILDATPDVVMIAEPSGRTTYMNHSARLLIGVGPEEDLSARSLGSGQPEWARRLVLEEGVPTATREGVWKGETAFLDGRGNEVPFSQLILAHRQPDERIAFISTIARDRTKEKELEARCLQAQKMEAIGRLAGGVAHDFNNLLSVILGSASLAADGLPTDHPSRAEIEEVKRAGERAAELTRRMLAFGRKQVLRPRVVDVNRVLDGMVPMVRRLVGEHIDLAVRLAPGVGCIKADPSQLEQVLLNLVVNARDAMPTGGLLTLETGSASFGDWGPRGVSLPPLASYVRIAVSDTGIGMDSGTRGRIFEPFFTTKGSGQGSGLGLSMVFGIVTQSGGEIAVDSEPGGGSTFRLYFPRCEDEPLAELAAAAYPVLASSTGRLVLLVEDEAPLRKLIAAVLRQSGYDVLVASGPLEAMSLARGEGRRIDLLLTDLVMPGMSGRELADRVAADRPRMPVLFMSGYGESGPNGLGALESAEHFLAKPFSPDALLATMDAVLGSERG